MKKKIRNILSYKRGFLFSVLRSCSLCDRGTNLIFGEISFVTNAAGSVLQLAVPMDKTRASCRN